MRHFLDLLDVTAADIAALYAEANRLRLEKPTARSAPLAGRVLGLVFEKPSLRTRVSFQSAIAQLGGSSVFIGGTEAGLGTRESIPDYARTMSQYVDAIVLRTFAHRTVVEFSRHSSCSVINGLSDYYHPCQALADLFTMQERLGTLTGRTLAFIGDGNNMARSLAICSAILGVEFVLAAPEKYAFDPPFLELMAERFPQAQICHEVDPKKAVARADVLYTDVWTSMGQEEERDDRLEAFADYQVNDKLLGVAPGHAVVMHCLPAHRGEEIAADVIESPRSIVFRQAGNRLHVQKALLLWLLQS